MLIAFSLQAIDQVIHNWAANLGWPGEQIFRLFLACILGGLIGLEREVRGRTAGFRTNILVCLGTALLMIVSISFAYTVWPPHPTFNLSVDPARIAYGVMSGIGFLGAGAIIKQDGGVRGLTTAAALWYVAALGLACGMGLYLIATLATVMGVFALWSLSHVERFIPKVRHREMTIRVPWHNGIVGEVIRKIEQHNINVKDATFERIGDLSLVRIHLLITFASRKAYYAFELEAESLLNADLISSSVVSS